ncbi:MAG TPA: acyl-CoA dehydrogenase family protein [Bacteroidota bacterium]|nr:acyl-CoA dehydrogenase family protein [Bacteroidota bacterium]
MMDFSLTEEQKMLRDVARRFTDEVVRPRAAEIDEKEEAPPDIIRKAAELGFLGVVFPEKYGGSGLGEVGYCLLLEEIARGCNSTAVTIGGHESLGAMAIYLAGSESQKEKYLVPLAAGDLLAAYALTEPQAGSDAGAIRTNARPASGGWLLDGNKTYITNGNIADVIVVFAVTDPDKGTHGGMTGFIIEKGFKGFRAGKPEKKMGIRGSHTTDLFFEEVFIPRENVLGPVGDGFKVAMTTLNVARVSLAAQCLGSMKELLDLSIAYANGRVQFGKPIAEQQAVQFMLSEMAADVYQIESILYRTALMVDRGVPFSRESAICKLTATEAVCRCADRAMQIHGGAGYMREYPIERLYRDARVHRIFEGTNEIQHLVIARDLNKKGSY